MFNLLSRNLRQFYIGLGMSLIFSLMPDASYAFKWPVVLDVSVSLTGPTEATYTGNWAVIDVDDSLDTYASKYTGVMHRHKADNGEIQIGSMDPSTELQLARSECPNTLITLSCIGQKWIEKNGESGTYTIYHNNTDNGSECVSIASAPNKNNSMWDTRVYPTTGVAQCIGTPPVGQYCALGQDKVEFSYSALTMKKATGATLTENITVECSDAIPYILRLRGNDKIPLDNGMYAELTTGNGTLLGETLTGQVGDNILALTSELKGTPNRTGTFNGSGVLFVTYP